MGLQILHSVDGMILLCVRYFYSEIKFFLCVQEEIV